MNIGIYVSVQVSVFNSFLNFLFCTGVESSNNVVTVSGGQQRDSVRHTNVSILPKLHSHPGSHITLNRVPCDIQ